MAADPSTELVRSQRAPGDSHATRRVLVVMMGDAVTQHTLPPTGEVMIGRGQDAALRVDHPSVSRRHLTLELGNEVRVRDLGSANGTSLRGARLPAQRPIAIALNEVFLAGDVALVVQVRRSPATIRPARDAPSEGRPPDRAITPVIADPAMQNLFELARRVAASSINVLITGESGTGKELLAEAIHAASSNAGGPLVRVNCAAIAENLLDSELFGHERGAFTGAVTARPGLIEAAAGGTLFLDEVGELTPAAQAKLLRVIEDRRVMRVGATEARQVEVRLVCATHRDLEADVAIGRFRGDLFFRVAAIVLDVPPLRERPGDLEPLVRAFAAAAVGPSRPAPGLAAGALAALRTYHWPGNVRELRNAVERAVVLADGPLTAADLLGRAAARDATGATVGGAPVGSLSGGDDERARIIAALDQCAGNQTRAARLLDMPLRTLVKRLGQYNLPRPKRG